MRISFQKPDEQLWYAIRVIPRKEKHLVSHLNNIGIQAWTPCLEKLKHYKSKTKKVRLPLIRQYIFVNITKEEYIPVLSTNYVIEFLHTDGLIKAVTLEEIEILKRVSGESTDNVSITTETLNKGDTVEFIGGEMTSVRGKLVSFRGKKKVAIELESLHSHLLIETEISNIRKLVS